MTAVLVDEKVRPSWYPPRQARFDVAPVLAIAGRRAVKARVESVYRRDWQPGSAPEIAEVLGVAERTVQRWRCRRGHMLPTFMADRLACRLGLHPCEIWDDWWSSITPDDGSES